MPTPSEVSISSVAVENCFDLSTSELYIIDTPRPVLSSQATSPSSVISDTPRLSTDFQQSTESNSSDSLQNTSTSERQTPNPFSFRKGFMSSGLFADSSSSSSCSERPTVALSSIYGSEVDLVATTRLAQEQSVQPPTIRQQSIAKLSSARTPSHSQTRTFVPVSARGTCSHKKPSSKSATPTPRSIAHIDLSATTPRHLATILFAVTKACNVDSKKVNYEELVDKTLFFNSPSR